MCCVCILDMCSQTRSNTFSVFPVPTQGLPSSLWEVAHTYSSPPFYSMCFCWWFLLFRISTRTAASCSGSAPEQILPAQDQHWNSFFLFKIGSRTVYSCFRISTRTVSSCFKISTRTVYSCFRISTRTVSSCFRISTRTASSCSRSALEQLLSVQVQP